MVQPTRDFLTEPENHEKDTELTNLGEYPVDEHTPGLNLESEAELPTEKTIPGKVGDEYIHSLAIEQKRLLKVALAHAREKHQGRVVFLQRPNPYTFPANWGLEVIDKVPTPQEPVVPLYVVFVKPHP